MQAIIQGITGKEAAFALRRMLSVRTNIVAGVRPGKGGEEVDGIPVFNTVEEAKTAFPDITTSLIYVPSKAAIIAANEAIDARVKDIIIISENIPVKDMCTLLNKAKEHNAQIQGPACLGRMITGESILGSFDPETYKAGPISIISKSGGLCAETAGLIGDLGTRQIICTGGDLLLGSCYARWLKVLEEDELTKAIVIIAEPGSYYEQEIIDTMKEITKPVIVHVIGKFAQNLPHNTPLGHQGVVVLKNSHRVEVKKDHLKQAGCIIAERFDDIKELVNNARK